MSILIDQLPYTVSEPGEYHLESDLVGSEGDYALRITASGVSVHLRGHTLVSSAGVGILLEASAFALRGGRLEASSGVALAPSPHVNADDCVLEELVVKGGLFLGARGLRAERVTVKGGVFGIKGGEASILRECRVEGACLGIEVGAGSRLERCTVAYCEEGVYAYGSRECPSHLERVVVYECEGIGLRLDGPGVLYACEAHNNGHREPAGGILAGPASLVQECQAFGNEGGDIVIVEPCELASNQTSDGSG